MSKELPPWRGIITALNIPFTAGDAVDLDALAAHADYALRAGVTGFLIPVMASEVGALTPQEREDAVRAVVAVARGRGVVIGGASDPDPARRIALARRWTGLGCDGVLAALPYENDTQYTAAVRELAAVEPPLLMLQDWDAAGFGVPVPLIARLFDEVPCFRCLKVEVVPAGVKYTQVLEATGGRLHVSGGWAVTQMVEAMDRGVHAFMPTGLHEVYVRIWNLHAAGRRDEARALFARLAPVLGFSNQHLDISIHFFKRLLHRQGIYPTARVRQAGAPFDTFHARVADELTDLALDLIRECRQAAG